MVNKIMLFRKDQFKNRYLISFILIVLKTFLLVILLLWHSTYFEAFRYYYALNAFMNNDEHLNIQIIEFYDIKDDGQPEIILSDSYAKYPTANIYELQGIKLVWMNSISPARLYEYNDNNGNFVVINYFIGRYPLPEIEDQILVEINLLNPDYSVTPLIQGVFDEKDSALLMEYEQYNLRTFKYITSSEFNYKKVLDCICP